MKVVSAAGPGGIQPLAAAISPTKVRSVVSKQPIGSRIPGFYKLGIGERREALTGMAGVEFAVVDGGGLELATADDMIENVVGTYALPLGVALNFRINERDYFVPMAIEEPSVVAAASHAAKLVRAGGGFQADATDPVMIAQVQLLDVPDPDGASVAIAGERDSLMAKAAELCPGLVTRGGGPRGIETRILSRPSDPDGGIVVVHLLIDCRDAMGANAVNTIAEGLAPRLAELSSGRAGLRILSNLATERMVTVRARIPVPKLGGPEVAAAIASASRFAELDPYRAATHNKGIMNGIDAVLLATANDWRGVEAGAHAYACQDGQYRPLATWRLDDGHLVGTMTVPMAVATVGGATQVHAGAKLSLALLAASTATELAQVVASVGLASNLAALKALATEGIQRGHMSLHARIVARAAGATGTLVERVAHEIAALGDVKPERAKEILARLEAEPLAHQTTAEDTP